MMMMTMTTTPACCRPRLLTRRIVSTTLLLLLFMQLIALSMAAASPPKLTVRRWDLGLHQRKPWSSHTAVTGHAGWLLTLTFEADVYVSTTTSKQGERPSLWCNADVRSTLTSEALDGMLQVTYGRDRLRFGEREDYSMMVSTMARSSDLEQWLSLFDDGLSNEMNQVDVLVVVHRRRSSPSFLNLESVAHESFAVNVTCDTSQPMLTTRTGKQFQPCGTIVGALHAVPVTGYSVFHSSRPDLFPQHEIDADLAKYGNKRALELHERRHGEGWTPHGKDSRVFDEKDHLSLSDEQTMIDDTYTYFVETAQKPHATKMDVAVDKGWQVGQQIIGGERHGGQDGNDDEDDAKVLLQVREHLEAETSLGVATGFVLFGVAKGFFPEAVKQATNKEINIWDKEFLPREEDQLGGEAPNDPIKGKSGTAEGAGALAKTIALDLLRWQPKATETIAKAVANVMSLDLHNSITFAVRDVLKEEITKAVVFTLRRSLPQTIQHVVPTALERILPPYLVAALASTLTNTLTRSVTHGLAPTLLFTLSRSPGMEMHCYNCAAGNQAECELCNGGGDNEAMRRAQHYSFYWSAFFSDYYSLYYGKGPGVEDLFTERQIDGYLELQ
eukprot:TRINITY_DN67716_c12_g1_i1.p1 TRINITY_DN67716_c12_g1~~TRINITY_DN67716_c12_g1_i1.p1  ORF type:complete len:625 (+),score=311.97 TRINITY_DN67716_c12_g1_i1:34-1875(+)